MPLGNELQTDPNIINNSNALQGFNPIVPPSYLQPEGGNLPRPDVMDMPSQKSRRDTSTSDELPKPSFGRLFLLGLLGGPNLVQFGLQQHYQRTALPKLRDLQIRGNKALNEDDVDTADEVLQGMNALAGQVPQLGRVADDFTAKLNEKRNKIEGNKTLIGVMKEKFPNDPVAQRAIGFVTARIGTLDPKQAFELFSSFKPEIKSDATAIEVISPTGQLLSRQAKASMQTPQDKTPEYRKAIELAGVNEKWLSHFENRLVADEAVRPSEYMRYQEAKERVRQAFEQGVVRERVPFSQARESQLSYPQEREIALGGVPQGTQPQEGMVSPGGSQSSATALGEPTIADAKKFVGVPIDDKMAEQVLADPSLNRAIRNAMKTPAWQRSGNVMQQAFEQETAGKAAQAGAVTGATQDTLVQRRPTESSHMYLEINPQGQMLGRTKAMSEAEALQRYAPIPYPVGTKIVTAYNFLRSDTEGLKKELSQMSGTEAERFWNAFSNFLSKGAGMPLEGVTPFGKVGLNFTGLVNSGLTTQQIRLAQKLVTFAQSSEAVMNPGDHPNIDVGQVKSILTSLFKQRDQIRTVIDVTKEQAEDRLRTYFKALNPNSVGERETSGEESRRLSQERVKNPPPKVSNNPENIGTVERVYEFLENLPSWTKEDIRREITEYGRLAKEARGALKPYLQKAIQAGKEILEMSKTPPRQRRRPPINPDTANQLGGFQ